MSSFLNEIQSIISKNREIIFLSGVLTLFMAMYFILWHYTIITFGSFYSVLDVPGGFIGRSISYLLASVVIASTVSCIMIAAKSKRAKKIVSGVLLLLFAASAVIRMFDWGALYFSGNHIDGNFWTHAFYTDGLVFLYTKESIALYISFIAVFVIMVYILKKMLAYSMPEE